MKRKLWVTNQNDIEAFFKLRKNEKRYKIKLIIVMESILLCVSNLLSSENILCNIPKNKITVGKNGKIKKISFTFFQEITQKLIL